MNLRVAAEHLGFRPRVRVLPSSTDPTLVAAVQLDDRHSHPGGIAILYPSVATRRTNRQPFADRRVPLSVLSGAIEAVDLEHGLPLWVTLKRFPDSAFALIALPAA